MKELIFIFLADWVMPAVILLLLTLTVKGLSYLSKAITVEKLKAQEQAQRAKLFAFEAAEKMVAVITNVVVAKLEQSKGKQLREQVKAGLADRKQLEELAKEAYQEIVDTVKPEVFDNLKVCVEDAESYLKNEIEKELLLIKGEVKEGS